MTLQRPCLPSRPARSGVLSAKRRAKQLQEALRRRRKRHALGADDGDRPREPPPRDVENDAAAQNRETLYLASDATSEPIALDRRTGEVLWRLSVPGVHELAVTHDGKTAYASRRTQRIVSVDDLGAFAIVADIPLSVPDTLQLSANEKLLTVGLRTTPATVANVETATRGVDLVTIGGAGTVAGHQWTSPSGRYTFASFEGRERASP